MRIIAVVCVIVGVISLIVGIILRITFTTISLIAPNISAFALVQLSSVLFLLAIALAALVKEKGKE